MTLTKVRDRGTIGIETDLSGVNNSLSRLGLRVIANQNLAGINGNDISYDTFQDATKIENLTNTKRNASEYVYTSTDTTSDSSGLTINNSNYSSYFSTSTVHYQTNNSGYEFQTDGRDSSDTWSDIFETSGGYFLGDDGQSPYRQYKVHIFDWGVNKSFLPTYVRFYHAGGTGSWQDGAIGMFNTRPSSLGEPTADKVELHTASSMANGVYFGGSVSTQTQYSRYFYIKYNHGSSGNNYSNWSHGNFQGTLRTTTETISATGSFEGTSITAPASTNKMGAVITYTDTQGTASLNTDLILDLSADNGSNYNRATLTALPDFASGVKCCKVNDLDITNAGTQLKYKISFANQSSGSKETRVTGVSLQY